MSVKAQQQPDDFIPWLGEDVQLSVTPSELHFSLEGGTKTVEVNSLALWRILEESAKYPVSMGITPISGIGRGTVTITLGADNRPSPRTRATNDDRIIKIVSGSQMVKLRVTQSEQIPM